jgi:hypothetical protein
MTMGSIGRKWLGKEDGMDDAQRYFYRLRVEGWQREHEHLLRAGQPRVIVQVALSATLARLRRYPTRWQLLRVNDMSEADDLAFITSLLDGIGAATWLPWSIRAAALYLRWQELDGTPEGPDQCCQR